MKILMVHNHYHPPSGENVVYFNEKNLLEDHGVDVVTYERSYDEIDESRLLKKAKLALAVSWSNYTYAELSRLIKKEKPQLAHFHNTFPLISPSAYAACQDNGVPVVQTLHNYRLICPGAMLQRDGKPCEDCVGKSLIPALRFRCCSRSLIFTSILCYMLKKNWKTGTYISLVDRYIALTEFAASKMVMGGIPRRKIDIKPNFTERMNNEPRRRDNYAVYVGLLNKEKGVGTLLKAWRNYRGLPLKILGEGRLRESLETYARKHDIGAEFLGYRSHDEVMRIVGGALFQIIPSECYEGFPMTVLEAYASGTSIIASRIGSLAEVIQDGVTGLLFEPGNEVDLCAKIDKFLAQPQLAHQVGAAGREAFDGKYTAERNFEILSEIYDRAIKEHAQSQS